MASTGDMGTVQWSNRLEFDVELGKFKRGLPEDVLTLEKRATAELVRGFVKGTPVREGRARGSWAVTHGRPTHGDTGRLDKSGGQTIRAADHEISRIEPFETTHVGSDLPYIIPLEEGHSSRNRGWVKATVHAVNAKFR